MSLEAQSAEVKHLMASKEDLIAVMGVLYKKGETEETRRTGRGWCYRLRCEARWSGRFMRRLAEDIWA